MMYEIIKQHPYIAHILVSNNGMVITTTATRTGNRLAVLKPQMDKNGYIVYKINKKTMLSHRLVAETFIPNPDNLSDVDHIDGDKKNNNVKNLRWLSHKDNMNNVKKRKICHRYSVRNIKSKFIILYSTQKEIHNELGISYSSIQHCLSGKWKSAKGYEIKKL